MMMMQRQRQRQDRQSKAFYELSAMVLNILRSPPPQISFSDPSPLVAVSSAAASSSRRSSVAQITPGGLASLLLGISLAMMFCGSITFFIGFILMPWVLGFVMFLYVAGIVSCLSMLGRSILCYATGPPPSPRKEIPSVANGDSILLLLVAIHLDIVSEQLKRCLQLIPKEDVLHGSSLSKEGLDKIQLHGRDYLRSMIRTRPSTHKIYRRRTVNFTYLLRVFDAETVDTGFS